MLRGFLIAAFFSGTCLLGAGMLLVRQLRHRDPAFGCLLCNVAFDDPVDLELHRMQPEHERLVRAWREGDDPEDAARLLEAWGWTEVE